MWVKSVIFALLLIANCCVVPIRSESEFESEEDLIQWLKTEYEEFASKNCYKLAEARWNSLTDTSNTEKQQILNELIMQVAADREEFWLQYIGPLNVSDYESEDLKRQLESLKIRGSSALSPEKLQELTTVQSTMTTTYSNAKICPYRNQECDLETEGLTLEPDIENIIATSDDYEELEYAWKAWRDVSGAVIRDSYPKYVELSNEVATANGFEDMGEMWRYRYETENFTETLDELWEQVKPLYDELHTYVRKKLQAKYGDQVDMSDGLIPAHILGNMWAQSWVNIEPDVRPFPNASEVDVTQAMLQQGYDVIRMFEESNDFYTSMGLEDNSMSYNESTGAMIERPDRDVLCHASAWDFCDGKTYRIKMCTEVDMEDLITVHHEMGHIQYFLLYKHQPITYRGGANPGFHEAVGDTIALSVATPQHLEKIGLLSDYEDDEGASINALMNMALERVAFLPFGLLIDKWRWDVFSGEVAQNDWNDHWWHYRQTLQKVKAPVPRDENAFDPGAKYHVAGDSQYINYFVAHILQFQLYRGLCIAAGEYDPANPDGKPLHKCDFYENTIAGRKLRDGLALGASRPWQEALELMTGETELDATAILDYFRPLYDYLYAQNRKLSEDELRVLLEKDYEPQAQEIYTAEVHADWEYATNLTPENAEALNEAILRTAAFDKDYWQRVFQFQNEEDYEDETLRRQVKYLKVLGNAALEEEQLSQLNGAISEMTDIYSTATICPYSNLDCNKTAEGLVLDPDIEEIISSQSASYDELLYAWTAWRDVTGAQMRQQYKTYVELSNAAAVANGFADKSEMWLNRFESDTLVEDLDHLWEQVEPLYKELHFYVSRKLKLKYGDDLDLSDRLIPAHVLGNMWAQSWVNVAPLVTPYPDVNQVNMTSVLIDAGFNETTLFDIANKFYTSLGLEDCSMSFGEGAMITRPVDRDVVCHASAWDFNDKETFRVKMCTKINYEDFITIHHELGHIQYYLLYKDQPITLRTGANPGFHEAVGDTIALSVATPEHFKKINLLPDYEESEEADINTLMDMALERVAFLPFGLLIDKWRWDVFSGKVTEREWNKHWWHYRETIQGVKAPVERTEQDFDPGAKFHVAADYQYISYFVAHILEFQFYKALCEEDGKYNPETRNPPLHKCDYYESIAAGDKLRAALSLGATKHWEEVLEILTGGKEMDASALLEYFEPLYRYLTEQNRNIPKNELELLIQSDFERAARQAYGAQARADWDFETNIGSASSNQIQIQTTLDTAAFRRSWHEIFQHLNEEAYTDDVIQTQLRLLKVLGDIELGDEKLSELRSVINAMRRSHSTTRICPYNVQDCNAATLGLYEEEVQAAMGRSVDQAELLYLWRTWREAAGPARRVNFRTYVQLANEAAIASGYSHRGEMWRSAFEINNWNEVFDNLWEEVEPLYTELHTFTRNKLKERYEGELDMGDEDDILIPAHILGSIWADSWSNLTSLVKPHPDVNEVDITSVLWDNSLSVVGIFNEANKFYLSLGLEDTSVSYGANSVIGRQTGREMSCHASAWDFHNNADYRVKICPRLSREGYVAVHHLLSHIQYFLLYKDQPLTLKNAANPAFYNAIGGALTLSAVTPNHLVALGLIEEFDNSDDLYLNLLMDVALEKVASIPFALAVDKWRWDVFSGNITENEWNERWWYYRESLQKVTSPIDRIPSDFEPGSHYNVIADEEYASYFAASILEFQIYRALCIKAGKYDPETKDPPLYECDFYDSEEVGGVLREALSLGASKPWSEVLEVITGETTMNALALREYFEPLYEYLKKENSAVVYKFSLILYLCTFLFVFYVPQFLW